MNKGDVKDYLYPDTCNVGYLGEDCKKLRKEERQTNILNNGGTILQETRRFDETKKETVLIKDFFLKLFSKNLA